MQIELQKITVRELTAGYEDNEEQGWHDISVNSSTTKRNALP